MASATSNIVTPQQAALNKKMNPSVFSGFSGRLSKAGNALRTGFTSAAEDVGRGVSTFRNAVTSGPEKIVSASNPQPTAQYGASISPNPKPLLPATKPVPVMEKTPTKAPVAPQTALVTPSLGLTGFAQTDPNRVINAQTGQTALQAANGQPATQSTNPSTPITNATDAQGNPIFVGSPELNQNKGFNFGNTRPPVQPTFPGLIGGLTSRAQDNSEVERANRELQGLRTRYASEVGNIESTPIPLEFQQGRTQVLGRQFASQEAAAQSALTNALTARGQDINALGTAAGLAAPVQVPFSNQFIDPATGQPILGNTSGGLQEAVNNVVSRLQAGTMTYNDALSALSGYGQGGVNALQQSLPPNFNVAQSNTLAGLQGSIGPAFQFAEKAINNVEEILKNLGPAQGTNIPAINSVGNWFSTTFGVGSEKTREYIGAVQALRNAYAALLAASKGGTPTDYSNQALAEIPNEPTPNDIAAIRRNFEILGQARKDIYGNPGQSDGNVSQSGSLTWDTL